MSLTPSGDILESAQLVALNAPPVQVPTSGEGAAASVLQQEDMVSVTSANVANSVYTMGPRIPTNAKVKSVKMFGKGIDTNATVTAAYDINVIFSDAPLGGLAAAQGVNDGTPQSYANQIPTSALTGAVTSPTTYASPNKMFGTGILPVANAGAYKLTDVTYAGTFTFPMRQLPLWQALGFAQDPGGYFNFYVVQSANSATAAAGLLGMIVDYVR